MKRVSDDYPYIRKCFPLTWCKCMQCGEEFKFERMWVALSIMKDNKNYYCCKDCAKDKEDAIQVFKNNEIVM